MLACCGTEHDNHNCNRLAVKKHRCTWEILFCSIKLPALFVCMSTATLFCIGTQRTEFGSQMLLYSRPATGLHVATLVVAFCTDTTTKLYATTYGWLSTDTTIQVHGNRTAQFIRLANVSIGSEEYIYTVECVGGHAGIPLHWECVARIPLKHILSMLAHAFEHIPCHVSAL